MEQEKYEALRKHLLSHTKIELIQKIANLQDMLDARETIALPVGASSTPDEASCLVCGHKKPLAVYVDLGLATHHGVCFDCRRGAQHYAELEKLVAIAALALSTGEIEDDLEFCEKHKMVDEYFSAQDWREMFFEKFTDAIPEEGTNS